MRSATPDDSSTVMRYTLVGVDLERGEVVASRPLTGYSRLIAPPVSRSSLREASGEEAAKDQTRDG